MRKNLNILALLPSADGIANLQSVFGGIDAVKLDIRIGELSSVGPQLTNGHAPDVLLVELGNPGAIEALYPLLRETAARLPVVVTAGEATLQSVRQIMRLGVADFIPQPLTRADVLSALEAVSARLAASRPEPAPRGQVVSFIRSCGGIGATTLAVQAAAELASRRKGQRAVCLLDFDLQFGNVALSFDLRPKVGLQQILSAPSRLDETLLRSSISNHDSGIDVLAAPDAMAPLEALTPELAGTILKLARDAYGYVVVDMPHAWTVWTGTVLSNSDLIVLVTEVNVTALQRARRQLVFLEEHGFGHLPIAVVANRFEAGLWGGSDQRRRAERALGRAIDGFVRSEVKAAAAARDRGLLLEEVKIGSGIAKDMRAVLERLPRQNPPSHGAASRAGAAAASLSGD